MIPIVAIFKNMPYLSKNNAPVINVSALMLSLRRRAPIDNTTAWLLKNCWNQLLLTKSTSNEGDA